MDWLNPIEWVAWIYGKLFQNHATAGGFVVVTLFAVIGLILWIRGVDKYKEDHPDPPQKQAIIQDTGQEKDTKKEVDTKSETDSPQATSALAHAKKHISSTNTPGNSNRANSTPKMAEQSAAPSPSDTAPPHVTTITDPAQIAALNEWNKEYSMLHPEDKDPKSAARVKYLSDRYTQTFIYGIDLSKRPNVSVIGNFIEGAWVNDSNNSFIQGNRVVASPNSNNCGIFNINSPQATTIDNTIDCNQDKKAAPVPAAAPK
jgi:hypothetical protein